MTCTVIGWKGRRRGIATSLRVALALALDQSNAEHVTCTVIGWKWRRRGAATSLRVALALVLDHPLAARVQLSGEALEAAAVRGGDGRRVHVLRDFLDPLRELGPLEGGCVLILW